MKTFIHDFQLGVLHNPTHRVRRIALLTAEIILTTMFALLTFAWFGWIIVAAIWAVMIFLHINGWAHDEANRVIDGFIDTTRQKEEA